MTRAPTIACLALALVATHLAGCARARERWKARFNPDPEPARLIEPGAQGLSDADLGLEVVVWTADDTGFRVGRAIDALGAASPALTPAEDARWRAAGFRVLTLPVDALDPLLIAAPPVNAVQRQRYAQIPRWTPILRGPPVPAGLAVPGAPPTPAGSPRLIARSWIEPGIADAARVHTLRTEFTVQIERPRATTLLDDPAESRISDAGPVIESLLVALRAGPASATVLVAEDPAVEWSDLPPPRPADPHAGDPDDAPDPGHDPGHDPAGPAPRLPDPVGPLPPRERTLGERMLASPGTPPRDGRPRVAPRKVIVAFIPRLRAAQPETPEDTP